MSSWTRTFLIVAWTSGVYNQATCEYEQQKLWTAASYGQNGSTCTGADTSDQSLSKVTSGRSSNGIAQTVPHRDRRGSEDWETPAARPGLAEVAMFRNALQ